jgi:hypothetical protein
MHRWLCLYRTTAVLVRGFVRVSLGGIRSAERVWEGYVRLSARACVCVRVCVRVRLLGTWQVCLGLGRLSSPYVTEQWMQDRIGHLH